MTKVPKETNPEKPADLYSRLLLDRDLLSTLQTSCLVSKRTEHLTSKTHMDYLSKHELRPVSSSERGMNLDEPEPSTRYPDASGDVPTSSSHKLRFDHLNHKLCTLVQARTNHARLIPASPRWAAWILPVGAVGDFKWTSFYYAILTSP